jgi:Leucine-rich repeat (LRR) protein
MLFKDYLKQYNTVDKRSELKGLSLENIDFRHKEQLVDAFKGLVNLTWLQLENATRTNQNYTTFPPHIFDDLTQLKKLYIENLKLTELNEDIFITMPLLDEIVFEYNYLSNLPAKVFQNQANLNKLIIRNAFDVHGAYMGLTLPATIFQPLTGSLTNLELDGNSIRELPDTIFYGLTNLRKLDLSGNQLQALPYKMFKDLNNLEKLDLSQNQLTLPLPNFEGIPKNIINATRQTIPMDIIVASAAAGGNRKRRTSKHKRSKHKRTKNKGTKHKGTKHKRSKNKLSKRKTKKRFY